jgi:thioredoxin 2
MNPSRHVVCGHCGRTNRLPADRPAAQGKCGACGQALFQGRPIEVDETTFERQLAGSDLPLLVDVWAPWCGPCRAMAPMFAKAAGQLEPDVRLLKLNADEAPSVSARYGIRSIPTMLLLRSGRLVGQVSGAMDSDRIVAWTRAQLATAGTG